MKPMKLLPVAIGLGAIGFVLMLFWVWRAPQPNTSADYAAWAQAVGSVLAIAAAIGLGVAEADRASKHRAADEHTRLVTLARSTASAASYLTATLLLAADRTKQASWTRGAPRVVAADLAGALAMLKAIPIGDLKSPAAATALLNLIQASHAAAVFMEFVDADVNAGQQVSSGLFSDMATKAQEATLRFAAGMKDIGVKIA